MADKKLLSKLEFVSFCIEQYKVATNRSGSDIEQLFQQGGVIGFLLNHYDALHTQGEPALLKEIDVYLKNHPR